MAADGCTWSEEDLEKIYLVSHLVYREEITPTKAAEKLGGMIKINPEAIKVFFSMYIHMRYGRIFKRSGGDQMIIYFLKRIAEEEREQDISLALKSVYGYAGFKETVGCYMDDLNRACAEIERVTGVKSFGV
ncbi:MAG TPA: hypothetical protein VJ857_03495 [Methanocorpusculum sp.]|nr:hypothetical protein [Methanocorpusculum sp.]HJJ54034.1 hypothetical protein [Methanocorpusculum sp.]HKL97713.1 hypothetical protein [Methanocorpusculum sp.]